MDFLDIFALIILVTLILTIVGGAVALAALPGIIARKHNHPQAVAINVCGWVGLFTLGIFLPIAFVWAFTKPATVHTQLSGAGQ